MKRIIGIIAYILVVFLATSCGVEIEKTSDTATKTLLENSSEAFSKNLASTDLQREWERDIDLYNNEFFPPRFIGDSILLVGENNNSNADGNYWDYKTWFRFMCLDKKSGEVLWEVPEDIFGKRRITDFEVIDDKIILFTELFDLSGLFFDRDRLTPQEELYILDFKTGEILALSEDEIKKIVNNWKLENGIKYEIYRHKGENNKIASIYDVEQDKVLWTLPYGEIFDYQITNDGVYFSYTFDKNGNNHIVEKYSFDGTLEHKKETERIVIFIYSGENLFFESGYIDYYDINYYKTKYHGPYESIEEFILLSYISIYDISLIDQQTLKPIWTKMIEEPAGTEYWMTDSWDKWYFEHDKIIAYDDRKIFCIDVKTGDNIWEKTIEQEGTRSEPYSFVQDGFLEIITTDLEREKPYEKSFYNLDDGKQIPEKSEHYSTNDIIVIKKYSSDGFIIKGPEWFDPKTFEKLGRIGGDICSHSNKIVDIQNGYVFYLNRCEDGDNGFIEYIDQHIICEKIK